MSFKDEAKSFGINAGLRVVVKAIKHLGNWLARLFMVATLVAVGADLAQAGPNTNWSFRDTDSETFVLTAGQRAIGLPQIGPKAFYRFNAITDSGWLKLGGGYKYKICLQANTGTQAQTGNDTTVTVLEDTGFDDTPALVDGRIILGLTLTGVASTGGVTNDCIHEYEPGRMGTFIYIDVGVAPLANDAYVDVTVLGKVN